MQPLDQILKQYEGEVFNTEDLSRIVGNRVNISRAREMGLVQKMCRGFYGVNAPLGREHLAIIAKYYKDSVICKASALYFQDLSDFDPGPIDLSVGRRESRLVDSELFTFHRIASSRTSFSVEVKNIQGFNLRIFTPERCLFEVAKHGPNSEEFQKCVVYYFKQYGLSRVDLIQEVSNFISGIEIVLASLHALSESKNIY